MNLESTRNSRLRWTEGREADIGRPCILNARGDERVRSCTSSFLLLCADACGRYSFCWTYKTIDSMYKEIFSNGSSVIRPALGRSPVCTSSSKYSRVLSSNADQSIPGFQWTYTATNKSPKQNALFFCTNKVQTLMLAVVFHHSCQARPKHE